MPLVRRLARYPASVSIALLCLVTFAIQLANDPANTLLGGVSDFELRFAFIPALAQFEPARAVVAPFLHLAPWHLLSNVGFVLILGTWLENDVGSLRIALLFVAGVISVEAVYIVLDPFALMLGASGGLMAIAAASLVMERKAPFAGNRRVFAAIGIASTLLLGAVAPDLGSTGAHAVGAIAGLVMGLVLPAPRRTRARREAERERGTSDWATMRETIVAAPASETHFVLQVTRLRVARRVLLITLLVVIGASTAIQAGLMQDNQSATVAVIIGAWSVGAGVVSAVRGRSPQVRIDLTGFTSSRTEPTPWSAIQSLYPGHIYAGLGARGAIGFVRRDSTVTGMDSFGHDPKSLAARLESIRLATLENEAG